MTSQMDALLHNDTWSLVPYDPSMNVLGCKCVFRIKKEIPLVLLIVIRLASLPKDSINWKAMTTQKLSVRSSNQLQFALSFPWQQHIVGLYTN